MVRDGRGLRAPVVGRDSYRGQHKQRLDTHGDVPDILHAAGVSVARIRQVRAKNAANVVMKNIWDWSAGVLYFLLR